VGLEVLVYSSFNFGAEYCWLAKANHQALYQQESHGFPIIQETWWATYPVSCCW